MGRIAIVVLVVACGRSSHAVQPTQEVTIAQLLRLRADATIASVDGDHATCVANFERAAALDPRSIDDAYDAAACHALAGEIEPAFRDLVMAIDRGYHDLELLRVDDDFERLRNEPRWADVERRAQAKLDRYLATANVELYRIVTDDQLARTGDFMKQDIREFAARDAVRLKKVKAIIEAGGLKTSGDYFNAALVAQHGETPEDFQLAHTLTLKAAELDPNNQRARWLAAAAADRELVRVGKPQRFGTQSTIHDGGIYVMNPVDPSVTDAERAQWNVRALADQTRLLKARTAAMQRKR